jgi:hypothetical protein
LLGLAIEKHGFVMIAVGPKCYFLDTGKKKVSRAKGFNQDYVQLQLEDYKKAIIEKEATCNNNMLLRMISPKGLPFQMVKQYQYKKVITPTHNKMRVLENNSCAPFIKGLGREKYIVVNNILWVVKYELV